MNFRSFIVAEKDDDLRAIYRRKLEQRFQGCRVIEALSCSEALETLSCASIDAVVVNQTLLDCNGLEALGSLRQTDAHLPLVSIGPTQVEDAALRCGATVFIAEARWAELGKTVEQVLDKRG